MLNTEKEYFEYLNRTFIFFFLCNLFKLIEKIIHI